MLFKVWRLNPSGNIDAIGYGSCFLPNKSGPKEFVCEPWRPRGSPIQEASAFYMGVTPKLAAEEGLSGFHFAKCSTQTTARIHLYC